MNLGIRGGSKALAPTIHLGYNCAQDRRTNVTTENGKWIGESTMRALLRVAYAIDALTEWLGNISTALVLITIAIGFYNVVVRYLGRYIGVNLASNLYIELQWYLYSLIFFLGFAYILKHDINVRVDFYYSRWSDKTKAWVNLL